LEATGKTAIFADYRAVIPKLELNAVVTKVQTAKPRAVWTFGPKLSWRPQPLPLKPTVQEFESAALWRIELPKVPANASISDVWLEIDYQGDVARLSDAGRLIDDNFWNGSPWTIGLKESLPSWHSAENILDLRILPLPKTYPMYLEKSDELRFDTSGGADSVTRVELLPQYQLLLQFPQQP
jgi:beta-galactosidase